MQAILALEDGRIFRGIGHGARAERCGEVVFNTSLTGYQEICTDPSYTGQIVVLTASQIGNYGTNAADNEATVPHIEGLVVREFSPMSSNWRSEQSAQDYLERHGVPAISDIDTRALVRHLRTHGVMRGVLATTFADDATPTDADIAALVAKAKSIPKVDGSDLAKGVSTKAVYQWNADESRNYTSDPLIDMARGERDATLDPDAAELHVVAYDFGIKRNILRMLSEQKMRVTVVPAQTSAEDVLAMKPDGVFLSNGPGDPEPLDYAHENIRKLMGKTPIFGICLGHQLIGLALGGKTYKLKFGHHGGNHPVKQLSTGKVEITAQNHNFVVDPESLNRDEVEATHINLNDQTLEGLRHKRVPMFSVQYHPEAGPGPHDSNYLFQDFRKMMEAAKR